MGVRGGGGGKFSYRFPLAFQLLRNDSATQCSQSTLWRQHFGSGHVHKRHIIICVKGTNKSLLRVNLSLSVMLYYPSDLKSLSPTNAVNICAMNVQNLNVQLKYEKPPVHFSPYPPTLLCMGITAEPLSIVVQLLLLFVNLSD